MNEVMLIAGARPNFMKIKPVLSALESGGTPTTLVHTGQHYDERMSGVFFDELGLRQPDHHLSVGSGTHATQTANVMVALEPLISSMRPAAIVVAGDVNSTMGAALVGAKSGTPVVHLEAGLRSRDWSMPEEINRVVTDRVSDLLLAPSPDAVQNLLAEGCHQDLIALVGNVMVDTLFANLDRARARNTLSAFGLEKGGYALVTLHRPANVDEDGVLLDLIQVLEEISRDLPVVFPMHPRTRMRLDGHGLPDALIALEPQGYLDFILLEESAACVLTDSGGVQEETTALGVPCLTLRENTERPVTLVEGTNRLVGRNPDRVIAAFHETLRRPPEPRRPALWDGHAGSRSAEAIRSMLDDRAANPSLQRRPTSAP